VKVAVFHATLPGLGRKPGGVDMVVHRLANALAEAGGMDVTVYSLCDAPPGARYAHRRLWASRPWLTANPLARFFVLPAMLNFVRFDAAQVIHLHGDDWFYIRRNVPTVRTMHGSALFEARTAVSWKRKVEQYCMYPMEWLAARLCDIPLAIGTLTAKLYRTRYSIDNGIDIDMFHPGAKTSHPQVFYIGTW
jgi:phosphatidylinositol alpha-mannosyltransferase